jgi:inward rectifier potassium channel
MRPDGSFNVERIGLARSISGDLYHFLMTASWPHLVFAILYRLDPHGVLHMQQGGFADDFFFSVQTSATIGYGGMIPGDPYTQWVVVVEAFLGILQVACITGVVVAKFARPTARVLWAEKMVVQDRDGLPELSFRVANARGNQIVEARIHVALTRDEVGPRGERFRRIHDLHLVRSQTPAFFLTWTVMHIVDEKSPLHGLTPQDLDKSAVAFTVTLTGLDDTIGQTVHARTVYHHSRIAWNHRYVDIISSRPDGSRLIDYHKFHDVIPVGR